jgi:hypothetical protein
MSSSPIVQLHVGRGADVASVIVLGHHAGPPVPARLFPGRRRPVHRHHRAGRRDRRDRGRPAETVMRAIFVRSCARQTRDSLIGGAQIAVDDIVNVHPDMNADVPLIAYKAHITPVVRGKSDASFGRSIDRKTHRQSLLCCARAHR